ncbi:3-methyl-2-oxobutanoate hydroxymethyltransferase [Granulicella cerasi]|uniref:3-methyl-2-oxobutanoate hydroxymethyltransferase n=1 Tax=Granulicella cerasi TaxID=741063 RepID=A0ABW1ZBB9_9BACT|nr:3-methyl-2-oxobutanoate hydroxymethyltransferase [Granulicella cerasi]
MSFHTPASSGTQSLVRVTAPALLQKKRSAEPITALTATDYPTARLADEAGVDLILVGDSLAMTVLGYDSTLPLTMDEMMHHARAVRRGVQRALLVVDMPYGSYQIDDTSAVKNALRFMQEAGAEAVKIEGGRRRAALVERLTQAEIPVVGHIGLTPQSVHIMGGFRVQARQEQAIETLLEDAALLEAAGAIAIVVEGVPREVAARVAQALTIPVIGIGAGPECDGQILVFHDAVQLTFSQPAKFVRRFAQAGDEMLAGLREYCDAVKQRTFPADSESYHLSAEVRARIEPQATKTLLEKAS